MAEENKKVTPTGVTVKRTVNAKGIELKLTAEEAKAGLNILERNGIEKVIVMKKHNGAAMWFTNDQNADNCAARHNYEYIFIVEKKDLIAK